MRNLIATNLIATTALAAALLTTSAEVHAKPLGPSFSCAKAADPVAATICADDRLPEIDLAYVQAFQALRQQLNEELRPLLRQEAVKFWLSVIEQCGLPRAGVPDEGTIQRAIPCVARLYQQRRAVYLSQLSLDAAEEAQRDLTTHLALQQELAIAGYLPSQAAPDGVYGPATRDAIQHFQQEHGLPASGLMTDKTAAALLAGHPSNSALPGQPGATVATEQTAPVGSSQTAAEPNLDAGQRVVARHLALKRQYASRVGEETATKLFAGNDGDLVIFTNESPAAAHFVRRVSGEGYFRGSVANICGMGHALSLERHFEEYAIRTLIQSNPTLALLPAASFSGACDLSSPLSQSDLLGVQRSDFTSSIDLQEQVVEALSKKRIRVFTTIDRSAFEMSVTMHDATIKRLDTELRSGRLHAFGLLAVTNDSTSVCASDATDKNFVARVAADINEDLLIDKKPGEQPMVQIDTVDNVFLAAKAGRCGFVFGDGTALKTFIEAFERDGFEAVILPVVLPRDKADALLESIQTEQRAAEAKVAQQQEEQSQLIEQQRQLRAAQDAAIQERLKLDEVRRKNDEAARRDELLRIRQLVASRVKAVVDGFERRLRKHIASVVGEVAATRERAALGQVLSEQQQQAVHVQYAAERMEAEFPEWSKVLESRVKEEWGYGDLTLESEDYGKAKWHSRLIEAVSVRVEISEVNKIIGERATECVVFTWINDEEFSFVRQAASFACDDYERDFPSWATANAFTSQWKLPPQ